MLEYIIILASYIFGIIVYPPFKVMINIIKEFIPPKFFLIKGLLLWKVYTYVKCII